MLQVMAVVISRIKTLEYGSEISSLMSQLDGSYKVVDKSRQMEKV